MSKSRIHAKAANIYVDEFDFSGVSNSVEINVDNGLAEVTAFADTDATFVEGKAGFTITVNGFISFTSPAYESEMWTDLTSEDRRVGIYPSSGPVTGDIGYEGQTDISAQPRTAAASAAMALNVTWQGDTPLIRATILDRDTARATSGSETAYQVGAVAAGETVVGILRSLTVQGGSGGNTLDVIVESDDAEAFTTPTTRLTFTQLSEVSGAMYEVKTQAGAITDDWWRVTYTYAGAGSRTFNLLITLGIRPT